MLCPRGFLLVRNMRTGDLAPFFLKVREQDIIWESGSGPIFASDDSAAKSASATPANRISRKSSSGSDLIDTEITDDGWTYETHTVGNRLYADGRIRVNDFVFITTKKEIAIIDLPFGVNADTSSVIVSKISGTMGGETDVIGAAWNPYQILEESIISARFVNKNEVGLSTQLEVSLFNPAADFTADALNEAWMDVCIHIAGYTV